MKRLLAVVPLAIALTLGAVSCASAPDSSSPATPTPTATPAPTPTASVEPGTLVEVTNRVFFDYNGNGRQDGEPALPDITLTYQPGNVSCVTDRNGVGTIEVPAGSYHIAVADPASQFHYILTAETTEIDDGLNVDISHVLINEYFKAASEQK